MRWLAHSILLMLFVPVFVDAQPATRPWHTRGDGGPPWRRHSPQESEAEWREVAEFYEKNAPATWRLYNKLQVPQARSRFRESLSMRFREIRRLAESEDKGLHKIKLDQLRIEDRIAGKVWEMKKPATTMPAEVRDELRSNIRELIQLRIEERRERIARIQRLVQQEEARLKEDETRKEEMLQGFLNDAMAGQIDWLRQMRDRPPGPRDGPGDGPREGRRPSSRPSSRPATPPGPPPRDFTGPE